ncbi:phage/colicin/tellurite resistance cluster TerY protein [Halalkalibacter wakoensis JCM 9140]|uniref:Phage/colicin/tellurite resistance cluster TerY protein n=1 Tax=Halalkalibacter wakoensis JCM 9140 TaxID=1236970 RepID=W4Q6A7_9BACI|nr:VWA domain-containing protein [Halalkalibacter wakoensis]GAE27522.1 phage/colicin/tellurite resistance cluster TerY protein [Halalkalibacter wakoensis JCM 9140]
MLNEFVRQEARPLPVILMLDVSGSMYSDGKINALNASVKEMLETFSEEDSIKAEIHVSIVTFGGRANLHTDLKPAREITFTDMSANGGTPLGEALDIVTELINNKEKLPSRSYRPSIILVSDGQPNDSQWEAKLQSFIESGRTAKCDRWSLGIGQDADMSMLQTFMNDPEKRVFKAEDANQISKFFRFITSTSIARTKSQNPNVVTKEQKTFDPFAGEDLTY